MGMEDSQPIAGGCVKIESLGAHPKCGHGSRHGTSLYRDVWMKTYALSGAAWRSWERPRHGGASAGSDTWQPQSSCMGDGGSVVAPACAGTLGGGVAPSFGSIALMSAIHRDSDVQTNHFYFR